MDICSDINVFSFYYCSNGIFVGRTKTNVKGKIWLASMNCKGYETKLVHCPHAGWGVEHCFDGEHVKIKCNNASEGTTAVITLISYKV